MQLTNAHRQALLNELESAKHRKEQAKNLLQTDSAKGEANKPFADACEIDDFLNTELIKIIETSIIRNQIDY